MGMCSTLVSMRVARHPRGCPVVSSGGYVRKNNTFSILLHNVLWRDSCGHFVRKLEESQLFGFTLDGFPFVHAFERTLLA